MPSDRPGEQKRPQKPDKELGLYTELIMSDLFMSDFDQISGKNEYSDGAG